MTIKVVSFFVRDKSSDFVSFLYQLTNQSFLHQLHLDLEFAEDADTKDWGTL